MRLLWIVCSVGLLASAPALARFGSRARAWRVGNAPHATMPRPAEVPIRPSLPSPGRPLEAPPKRASSEGVHETAVDPNVQRLLDGKSGDSLVKSVKALWNRASIDTNQLPSLTGRWAGVCAARFRFDETGEWMKKLELLDDDEIDRVTPQNPKGPPWEIRRSRRLEARHQRAVAGVGPDGDPTKKDSFVLTPIGFRSAEAQGNLRPMAFMVDRRSYGNQELSTPPLGPKSFERFEARLARLNGETVLVTRGTFAREGSREGTLQTDPTVFQFSYCVFKRTVSSI